MTLDLGRLGLALWPSGARQPVEILTAGTEPPFAINLRMGLPEAGLTLLINVTGLLSALLSARHPVRQGRRAMAVLLIFTMALCGIVLTRDLFNLFVFFELVAIATGGLILLSRDNRALGAGFKFLVASQVITILLLVGIIFSYHATGTLNIDGMAEARSTLLQARRTRLLPDAYRGRHRAETLPGQWLGAGYLRVRAPGLFGDVLGRGRLAPRSYAVDKLLLIGGADWLPIATGIGIVSFVGANLFAPGAEE